MLESLFFLICPPFFFDKRITTLDQWQKASHVAIVEVESLIHFPPPYKKDYHYRSSHRALPVWKLKVIEMLTEEKPEKETIYTSFNALPSLKEKDRAILSFANFITYDPIHSKKPIYPSLYLLHRNTGEMPIYGHPYYKEWPLLENEDGQYYLPDCLDGLTETPLTNPLVNEIKELTRRIIDEKPNTKMIIGLWPSHEESQLEVCKCKNKKYNLPWKSKGISKTKR